MTRQFTLPQGTGPGRPTSAPARIAVVAGLVALAVIVKACGDAKPRVQDIPRETSSSSLAAAPAAATPAVMPPSGEPVVSGPVTFAEGEAAFHERRFDRAAALFTAYTVQHADNAWGYYMLGLSEWKAGRPERAVPAFEQALERDTTHRKALLNLTRVLLETGKAEDGLARAQRVVALDAGLGEGWRLMGRALGDLGRTDDAVTAYRRALALDETDVWSMNNLGMLYLQAGRFAEALPPLARAAELAPERATFQNNLGLALERTGQRAAAILAFRAAVAADTTHAKAAASLSRVEGQADAPDTVPVDVAALARAFADDIGRWKAELAVLVRP